MPPALVSGGLEALPAIVASWPSAPAAASSNSLPRRFVLKRFGWGLAAAVTNRDKMALTSAKPDHEKALFYLRFFVLNG